MTDRTERKFPEIAQQERDHDLVNRFTFHPATGGQPEMYERIRAAGLEFARLINAYCPGGQELHNAVTAVDQAVMWANAAIARNG